MMYPGVVRAIIGLSLTIALTCCSGTMAGAAAKSRRRSGISVKRNASQVARAPGAVRRKSFFRMAIKLAGADVPLNRGVELRSVERLEPGTKALQLARRKLFDGFLDIFGRGHMEYMALWLEPKKGRPATRRARRSPKLANRHEGS
jgi:hypothetical protein